MALIKFLFSLIAGSATIKWCIAIAALLGFFQIKSCSIERKAYKAGQQNIIQKSTEAQNEKLKKARNARRRAHAKRVRKQRDPYRRD